MMETTDRQFVKDNIPEWDLSGTFYPIKAVWSERLNTIISYDEEEFMYNWRLLHRVWMNETPYSRGCLSMGSSRETLAYWVFQATGEWVNKQVLRTALEIGVALEWAIPNQGKTHSAFLLRPIRYEHLL